MIHGTLDRRGALLERPRLPRGPSTPSFLLRRKDPGRDDKGLDRPLAFEKLRSGRIAYGVGEAPESG